MRSPRERQAARRLPGGTSALGVAHGMTWIIRDAAHRVEHGHHQLRARLVALEVHRCHRDALTRAAGVARTKMVERERENILLALLTAAKRRIAGPELVVHVFDRALEKILHTASGSAARSETTEPVKVDPVVPVSSTVRYAPIIASSPGTST